MREARRVLLIGLHGHETFTDVCTVFSKFRGSTFQNIMGSLTYYLPRTPQDSSSEYILLAAIAGLPMEVRGSSRILGWSSRYQERIYLLKSRFATIVVWVTFIYLRKRCDVIEQGTGLYPREWYENGGTIMCPETFVLTQELALSVTGVNQKIL